MQYHCRVRWAPDHSPVWGVKGKQTKVYFKTCPACKFWKANGFQGRTWTDSLKQSVEISLIPSANAYVEIVKND